MRNRDLAFNTVAAFIIATAFLYFGSGFALHLWKTEVGKAAMILRVGDVIDAQERLWILESVRQELEIHNKGAPQLWSMTLTELVNRPDDEFVGLKPGRLGLLRRLYMKFHIPPNSEG